jgi:uncharacterized protein YndB with AHSA1/START domain
MWQSETSTEINAPPERVYAYLADFLHHKEWSRGVAEIEPVGATGAVAVGTELKATETIPRRMTSIARVTALEPPRRIAWDARVEGVMRVQWEFELQPTALGTRLVQRCRWQPQNLLGTVMLNLVRKRQVPKENQASLARIKAILEEGR